MATRDLKTSRPDPLVDEIRAIRKCIEQEAGGSVRDLAQYVRRVGEAHRRKMKDRAKVKASRFRKT